MTLDWKSIAVDWCETGSRYVCDPPVMDTDHDYIVFDPNHVIHNKMQESADWEFGGSEAHASSEFMSYVSGRENVILIDKKEAYDKFVLATKIAKILNVKDKAKRVALFEAIRHGVYAYE